MIRSNPVRVGILYPGSLEERRSTNRESRKLPLVFGAFETLGAAAEPAVYHEDFNDEVKQQLLQLDAVLVWVNPIVEGRDRSKLDSMLREVAATGVFVSTHPDTILKLGTKDVLHQTRELGWGSDTHRYSSLGQMREELPARLSRGEVRVLKQYRGHSGIGIWRIEREAAQGSVNGNSLLRVHHAQSGCIEEVIRLDDFMERCLPYFNALNGEGRMIDQVWQPRLPEGMVRCYLVQGKVEGFGRQEFVALHPSEPNPTKRLYHPPTLPEFQRIKTLVEKDWVPGAQRLLGIESEDLPMLWDCDFMFGPQDSEGKDTYVLCEINVSCVSPFPDSAAEPLARAVIGRVHG